MDRWNIFFIGAHALGENARLRFAGVGEYCQKFFATPATECIGIAHDSLQLRGDGANDFVAGIVAVTIIDAFEVINIAQDDRERLPGPCGALDMLDGGFVECAAIG